MRETINYGEEYEHNRKMSWRDVGDAYNDEEITWDEANFLLDQILEA